MASDVNQLSEFEKLLMKSTSFGWAGVNLFFVISGFLIGTILIKNKMAGNYFKVFYFRRILRIIPLYYLFLLIYLFLEKIVNDNTLWLFEKPIPIWHYFLFIQNFSFGHLGHFGPNSITPTWSLAIEEQFYLLAPFLIYYLRTKHLLFISLIFISIAPIFRAHTTNWYMEYNHLICRLDAPFFGIILAICFNEKDRYMKIIKSKFTIVTILGVLLTIYFFVSKSINHTIISFLFFYVILFFISLKEESSLSSFLQSKLLLFVGKLSFFICFIN
jgi:peptidoglycan/LPS O-acetylase OafA/YrhL